MPPGDRPADPSEPTQSLGVAPRPKDLQCRILSDGGHRNPCANIAAGGRRHAPVRSSGWHSKRQVSVGESPGSGPPLRPRPGLSWSPRSQGLPRAGKTLGPRAHVLARSGKTLAPEPHVLPRTGKIAGLRSRIGPRPGPQASPGTRALARRGNASGLWPRLAPRAPRASLQVPHPLAPGRGDVASRATGAACPGRLAAAAAARRFSALQESQLLKTIFSGKTPSPIASLRDSLELADQTL